MLRPNTIPRRHLLLLFASLSPFPKLFADSSDDPLHFVARTIDGEKLTTDALRGKVVLIEFWATWCPYCKKEEPILDRLGKEFEKDGLVILAVDMGEPKHRVKKYLEDSPRTSKIVLAQDTTLAAICDAHSYPMYVLLDRDGRQIGDQHGAAGEKALRNLLSRAGLRS
ncbi:MAG: TlpA family protein disulfide reductase [Acidobacteriaceae bacterium]|nr:TlpA family protein disulfide reductase [Acidobacteriaceae bacterium]